MGSSWSRLAGLLVSCCTLVLMASPALAQRALVIDYELNPPDFSNELLRRLAATGLTVDHRQYYPVLTEQDLDRYAMLVLLASAGEIGSGLQLDPAEVPALVDYVQGGGLVILGVPSDPEAFGQLAPYNQLLADLRTGIQIVDAIADDEAMRYPSSMFQQAYVETVPGTFAAPGADRQLVLDRGTILTVEPPALTLAKSSPTAFAIVGLGRDRRDDVANPGDGFPLVAMAQSGNGYVLVTGRFSLNIGGFNGRVGVQPVTTMDWVASSDRFMQNILNELVNLGRGYALWKGPRWSLSPDDPVTEPADLPPLPARPPATTGVTVVEPGGALTPAGQDPTGTRDAYRAVVRRDLYGQLLDEGIRAAWGAIDRDDAWLTEAIERFSAAGINYIWGVGWPERFISDEYSPADRRELRRAWDTLATGLDETSVGWTVGLNYPGVGFDFEPYARSLRADGAEVEILSPLDLGLWHDVVIPAIEEVARFSAQHPSVKGMTIDLEMYGWEPIIFYPEAIGFEDVAFEAFLRAATGHLEAELLAEAAALEPAARYVWLRDRGLLTTYFQLLELEAEKLGHVIRERVRSIDPNFIFGAYQAGFPYSWFYRGLMRGLSTPAMPMVWLSFQGQSAGDVDRFWRDGVHVLNAAPLMLGTHPIESYGDVIRAAQRYHDGYWLNRFTWLLDDAEGRTSIEIPNGPRDDAWRALQEANVASPAGAASTP